MTLHSYILTTVNVDPVCSTQTTMKVNIFRPERFIYRTAVTGAMLRVVLNGIGENFYLHFNRWVKRRLPIGDEYLKLLEMLPDVSVTDGVLVRKSKIVAEHYNVILDGTATALGTIKGTGKKGEMGPLRVYKYQIFGLDSDLTRRVINYLVHYFWAPGGIWRFALISEDQGELERALSLFRIAIREFGLGAKHAFRGKMMEVGSELVEVKEVDGGIRGRLLQPVLCENGVSECLKRNGLRPVGTFRVIQRMRGYQPKAEVVPAIWGEFETDKGYYVSVDGDTFLITEDDLSWPPRS